jgi:hypothetical protein
MNVRLGQSGRRRTKFCASLASSLSLVASGSCIPFCSARGIYGWAYHFLTLKVSLEHDEFSSE